MHVSPKFLYIHTKMFLLSYLFSFANPLAPLLMSTGKEQTPFIKIRPVIRDKGFHQFSSQLNNTQNCWMLTYFVIEPQFCLDFFSIPIDAIFCNSISFSVSDWGLKLWCVLEGKDHITQDVINPRDVSKWESLYSV